MSKKSKKPVNIFFESIGLYFSNFDKFIQYMSFPVLGQIFGFFIIIFTSFFYISNIDKLVLKYPQVNNLSSLLLLSVLIMLPGLTILCKALWEYLIAYGAINSMVQNMLKSGRVYDFTAHTELIQRRSLSFICVWFLLGIFSIIAICPLFWIICAIISIYIILVFQVFAFEPELTPIGCFKKSFLLIKGHFLTTFFLLILTGILTYFLIPQIALIILDKTGFNSFISNFSLPIINLLPELNFEPFNYISIPTGNLGVLITQLIITQILIQYTLPMRSIQWALWYRELNNNTLPQIKEAYKKQKTKKQPSEKLMEESNKKYGKKKLDTNILKRAMEKEEDE